MQPFRMLEAHMLCASINVSRQVDKAQRYPCDSEGLRYRAVKRTRKEAVRSGGRSARQAQFDCRNDGARRIRMRCSGERRAEGWARGSVLVFSGRFLLNQWAIIPALRSSRAGWYAHAPV